MNILLKYHIIVIATQNYFFVDPGAEKIPQKPLGTTHKKKPCEGCRVNGHIHEQQL